MLFTASIKHTLAVIEDLELIAQATEPEEWQIRDVFAAEMRWPA